MRFAAEGSSATIFRNADKASSCLCCLERVDTEFIAFQRRLTVSTLDQLRKAESLVNSRRPQSRQLFVVGHGLCRVADFRLLVEKCAQQFTGFVVLAQGHADIGGLLTDLLILGFVFQNGEVLLQGVFRLALLQVLLRFFQTFLRVSHGSTIGCLVCVLYALRASAAIRVMTVAAPSGGTGYNSGMNAGVRDEAAEAALLELRKEFPILERSIYLISNSLGAMPRGVYDATRDYCDTWASRGVRAWEEQWWDMARSVGDEIGRLMNAQPGTISCHQNVTQCEAIVASCLDFPASATKSSIPA